MRAEQRPDARELFARRGPTQRVDLTGIHEQERFGEPDGPGDVLVGRDARLEGSSMHRNAIGGFRR